MRRPLQAASRAPGAVLDLLFLVAVVVVSATLYVDRLGFHGDDWGYFAALSEAPDGSFLSLAEAAYERDIGLHQRPAQLLYVTTTYYLFGLRPLGYHVVGSLMLIAIALLLYGILRELEQPRAFAVAIPLVYVLLPHYSGARLWYGAHTAVLSIVFLTLSAYALLRALRAGRGAVAWGAAGAIAAVASVLSYELTLPVVALLVAAVVFRPWAVGPAARATTLRRLLLGAAYAAAAAFTVAYKAAVTTRVGIEEPYLDYLLRIARGALQVNFGAYGAGIPYVVGWILVHAADATILAVSTVVGVAAGLYIGRVAPVPAAPELRAALRRYVVAGLLLFVAGCAIFVVPTLVHFESTGRDNRITVAAALGVAVTYIGLLAGIAALPSAVRRQRALLGASVGLLCASASVITQTQAAFWIDSYEQQQTIERRIVSDVRPLPTDGALILDGVCLQRGGAWVFTGARDLPALLRLKHGARGIRGATVTRPVVIDDQGIHVKAFSAVAFFPYANDLLVYNYARRTTYRLTGKAGAATYFANRRFRPERDCPTVFAWGLEGI